MSTRRAAAVVGERPRPARVLPEVTLAGVRDTILALGRHGQIEGFGVFGSLGGQQARQFHADHSDIDVFLVLKERYLTEQMRDRWEKRVREALEDAFGRKVDVMTFSIPMLKKVPGWHTISMASDCPILYDPEGRVADVFRRIVQAARDADLAQEWVDDQRVWVKQHWVFGENIVVEVTDDDH